MHFYIRPFNPFSLSSISLKPTIRKITRFTDHLTYINWVHFQASVTCAVFTGVWFVNWGAITTEYI